MINNKLKDKIATAWPKAQQRDFYTLIGKKRQQVRLLIQRLRTTISNDI